MEDKVTVAVLAGTTREKRESIKAAHYVAEFGRQLPNVEIIFVDPRDFTFPNDGNDPEGKDTRYTDIVAKADAFFIVTPEYNHSIPGSLKRMLDSEYDLYWHKPVALAGCSNGPWGGVRVCEALLPVCHRMGMVNIQPEVYFPKVQEIFDERGTINPEYAERYDRNIAAAYNELVWFARLLKAAR
ncbi:MAG TPA: NAD(P)H-dependent oxidoreductase [Candidatus Saccharimonadales bacterium]|nr:NAD(P)H-dependent oxidoreductase [Candidatus Saccharimonadales bacterium]